MIKYIIEGNGFPFSISASNTKAKFLSLGLKKVGKDVFIFDSLYGSKNYLEVVQGVSEEGINYIIFPRKHGTFSILANIPAFWRSFKSQKESGDEAVILSRFSIFPTNILSFFITTILGFKTYMIWDEWHQSLPNSGLYSRFNNWFADVIIPRLVDGVLPISHFLNEKAKIKKKESLIIPIAANFDYDNEKCNVEDHFTFCGSAFYVIRNPLLIDSFKIVVSKYPFARLKLILSAIGPFLSEINKRIEDLNLSNNVDVYSGITDAKLHSIYKSSRALLIPLDPNNIQDKARFSQKIAEYISTGRPIISSPVGEMPYYFTDNKDAFLVSYSADAYAKAMINVLSNPKLADEIGKNGFELGKNSFDYRILGARIHNFIIRCQKSKKTE